MKKWHFIFLSLISLFAVWVIYDDVRSTAIDYLSGLGSIASIYAIIIAWSELKSVKAVAKATKVAVDSKMIEISNFITYADIEKHIEICSNIIAYIKADQYEAAALRLEDLKKALLEIKNNNKIKEKSEFAVQKMVARLGTDITSIRNKWIEGVGLDTTMVLDHVNEVSTFLQDISTKLKHNVI